jgi:hypothetical protein
MSDMGMLRQSTSLRPPTFCFSFEFGQDCKGLHNLAAAAEYGHELPSQIKVVNYEVGKQYRHYVCIRLFVIPLRRLEVEILGPNIPKHFSGTTLCFAFVRELLEIRWCLTLESRPSETETPATFSDSGWNRFPDM